MICKHCQEPIERNTVHRSQEPFVYHPHKHSGTHLIGCWDPEIGILLCEAEPEEEK